MAGRLSYAWLYRSALRCSQAETEDTTVTTILTADSSALRVTSRRSTISANMIPDEVRDAGVDAVEAYRAWTARQQAPKLSFETVEVETLAAA